MPGPIPRRAWLRRVAAAALAAGPLASPQARADDNIELNALKLRREDGQLMLEFSVRPRLTAAMGDALQRGMPLYFVARATVRQQRWYWRDRRVARVERRWRIAYQPLTSTWRVSLGALSQTVASLAEAMALASAAGSWRVADLEQLPADAQHYLEFAYQLDTSQLPSPMQLALPGNTDWQLRLERQLPVPAP